MWKENQKFKIGITVVLGLLIIGCYIMIFMFSADSAEESSAVSQKVTEMLMRIYRAIFEENSSNVSHGASSGVNITELLEKLVRKLAHFIEYMMLGSLSYLLSYLWIKKRRYCVAVIIIQLFVSAGLDEMHQSFVPGRYASFWDVLLDLVGGMTGILLVIGIIKLKKTKKSDRLT